MENEEIKLFQLITTKENQQNDYPILDSLSEKHNQIILTLNSKNCNQCIVLSKKELSSKELIIILFMHSNLMVILMV